MQVIEHAVFAFLVGVTAAGFVGSLMQIATGRTLGFVEPYVTPSWLARSLMSTLAAGPMMLGNDALEAWRTRRIGWTTLAVAVAVSFLWSSGTGVVILEIASRMARPLG